MMKGVVLVLSLDVGDLLFLSSGNGDDPPEPYFRPGEYGGDPLDQIQGETP